LVSLASEDVVVEVLKGVAELGQLLDRLRGDEEWEDKGREGDKAGGKKHVDDIV
jgi:hypothetical protein